MTYDIVIIGGGISGLYNYMNLINNKKKIILLEQNNYFGGRIYQHKETINSQNYYFPSGAARFNINHKHVIRLLKHFKLLDFRKDKPINADINFIDTKNSFSDKFKNKHGFFYIDKVIKYCKKIDENILRSYTFKQISSKILNKEELEFMLIASGYSGQLKNMNAFDALKLFTKDIRPDLIYYYGKYDILIKKIVEYLKNNNANLNLNSLVKNIKFNKEKNNYEILYNNTKIFGEKIIFSIPKYNLLKFNILKPIHCILDKSIHCKKLCRTYAIFRKEDIWYQNIKKKIVTNNQLRYVIPMGFNNPVIMISYSDDIYTDYWKKIQNDQKKLKQSIVKLVDETFNIKINEPLKVIVSHWECGVAYWRKNINSEIISNFLLNPLPNIYISGENYSLNQSWVNGALDSCEKILPLIVNN